MTQSENMILLIKPSCKASYCQHHNIKLKGLIQSQNTGPNQANIPSKDGIILI